MTIVLDTTVLIDHLRTHPGAVVLIDQALTSGERLASSVLTRFEVLQGMRAGEEDSIFHLFARVDWIPVDAELADRAGWLANAYDRSHPGIDAVDYVVAATAERLDAELWTHNLKHFPMFPGLQRPY